MEREVSIKYTNSVTCKEYNTLRQSVGWSEIESVLTKKGLKNSAFIICARCGKKAVGMARVITDYGYVVYIADVMVLPEYQGMGIGGEIMRRVMEYINKNISPGQGKYVTLAASKGKEGFYEKFGLVKRPTQDLGSGMSLWIQK
ncbi:MAG: GNAT family N-acetyltransferase [Clostridiales bacterium]|nr:GNAT family N-acetyltransferase [Clostridiales bacterium]